MNLALRRMPAITPTDRAALVSDANRGRGFEVARQLSEYGVTVLPGARRHYRRLVNPSSGCAGVAKRSSKSALSAYVRALAMELEGGGICAYRDTISANHSQPRTRSQISLAQVSIGTASSAPGMPHNQPHTSSHSRIAIGDRRMLRPWISGVIRLPSTMVMAAKVSAGRNTSSSAVFAYSIDTKASTKVVKIAPTYGMKLANIATAPH